jgi:hypothetical protein
MGADKPLADVLLTLRNSVGHQVEADANGSFHEEVHLFVFFVINEAIFIRRLKVSREEPLSNLVEKPLLGSIINVEELLEFLNGKQVLEKINCQDLSLKLIRQTLNIVDSVHFQTMEPVMSPDVGEVLLYLLGNVLVDTRIVGKSSKINHPVVEISALVRVSHLLVEVTDDFNEVTHDVREESYSSKHDEDGNASFGIVHGIVISVANCTEGGQGKVAASDELVGCLFLMEMVELYKGWGDIIRVCVETFLEYHDGVAVQVFSLKQVDETYRKQIFVIFYIEIFEVSFQKSRIGQDLH